MGGVKEGGMRQKKKPRGVLTWSLRPSDRCGDEDVLQGSTWPVRDRGGHVLFVFCPSSVGCQ